MSLNTRNVTQGGQVLKYMISMFMQINNIIVYWILMASVGIFLYLGFHPHECGANSPWIQFLDTLRVCFRITLSS